MKNVKRGKKKRGRGCYPTPKHAPSKLRVLVLAYSISPVRGSEYSVGWNHIRHMAEFCDLTVLYGLAGPHMGDIDEIQQQRMPIVLEKNVHFVPVIPNIAARIFNYPNRKGFLVYSFYLAYRIWHFQAARKARQLISTSHFDVVHYLCPIGYREPGYLWKLEKPYVWGPIGGLGPTRFLHRSPRPLSCRLKVYLKNVLNSIQLRFGQRVGRALARVDRVIASTTENKDIILRRFGVEAQHIPENAIPKDWCGAEPPGPTKRAPTLMRLIWIGSLDYRKSPDLLVDALARVKTAAWHLDIVGDGPLREEIRDKILSQGLSSQVTLHGNLSRSEVFDRLSQSNLHVVTSLNEGNPTVIWEAMAAGVPTLTLDHCGMHDTICANCGVRVPISDYPGTRDHLAQEIEQLALNPDQLMKITRGTLECREQYSWTLRAKLWLDIYRNAIHDFAQKEN